MFNPPLPIYPTSAYQNPPIEPQYYQPSQFFISAVSLGINTTVTTTVDHNYVIGQLVRLLIPYGYGCRQLNQQEGYVLSIPAANQVLISLDSSKNVDNFTNPGYRQQPQIVAVGDVNTGIISSTGTNIPTTNIPGAFIDVS